MHRDSGKIAEAVLSADFFKSAEQIFCYASVFGEVDTFYLMGKILETGKSLALPKVSGKEMIFYRVEKLEHLQRGYMGILEPTGESEPLEPGPKTMLIMPGLAFDKERHRVGYGGGYYDRYLSGFSCGIKVALAFDFQIMELLEHEETDVNPDIIILPEGLIY